MRTSYLLLLLLLPLPSLAAWTGMGAFVGQGETDWLLATESRLADSHFYGLHLEEKTQKDLRVGASAGQFSLRLLDPQDVTTAEKFDGQFLSLYLRLPLRLNSMLSLHSGLSYRYHQGEKTAVLESTSSELIEISWHEFAFELGVSLEAGLLSVRPFISLSHLDGDITSTDALRIFTRNESLSRGLMLDYFVERSAYIRLKAVSGAYRTMQISFVREY